MKSIKDLRENYNLITEKEEHDMNKLTQLVRAGLFDAKKLSALKRAMDKPADKMTAQEKRMMINLLDALMAEVLSDKMVYRKIKQDVMKEAKDYYATPDPRVQRVGYPSQKEAPSVLLLKRKAIRVFPDGQKVALYYAQAIDKYVSIPYNEIGINEEVELDEISLSGIASGVKDYFSGVADRAANNSSSGSGSETKYLEPLKREPSKLDVGASSENNSRPDAIRSRTERLSRLASQEMAKGIRENFQNKLEVLREFKDIPTVNRGKPKGRINRGYEEKPRTRPLPKTEKPEIRKETPKSAPENKADWKKTAGDAADTVITSIGRRALGPAYAFWKGLGVKPANRDEPATIIASPEDKKKWGPVVRVKPEKTKIATPPKRPTGSFPKAKADAKGTSAFTKMPSKSAPEATKLPPAPKNPNAGITNISKPSDAPETEVQKKLKVPQLNPAKSPTTGDTPGYKNAQDFADDFAKASDQAKGQPWKGADNWKQPATEPKSPKKKPDEEGTKKREPEEKPSKRRWWLPGLALGTTPGKDLIPLNPKLKLPISAPKREGDADAIKSRQAAIERAALKAQASMNESVDLDGNMFELNNKEAEKVVALYESLNKTNKKKMVKMMNESSEGLEKVISFAVRQ